MHPHGSATMQSGIVFRTKLRKLECLSQDEYGDVSSVEIEWRLMFYKGDPSTEGYIYITTSISLPHNQLLGTAVRPPPSAYSYATRQLDSHILWSESYNETSRDQIVRSGAKTYRARVARQRSKRTVQQNTGNGRAGAN